MLTPFTFHARALACAALILLTGQLHAQQSRRPPELTVQGPRGERAPLSIVDFEAQISFCEDLAETTLTVTFANPSDRMIEGEFAMELPKGATVSGYALDVQGKMRESSVVEKERARFAYESIKRQMIDPGFVEREEGNVYRTKIFPIPAEGTKAVRLSYCEVIDPNGATSHYDYQLPLPTLALPSCHLRVTQLQGRDLIFPEETGPHFQRNSPGHYHLDASGSQLPPLLKIRLPAPQDSLTLKSGLYQYERAPAPTEPRPLIPEESTSIQVVWDCSESGHHRHHAREFALLDQLFKAHPQLTVQLTLLGLTSQAGGDFVIHEGDWAELKEALSKVFYDGASHLSALPLPALPTLIFSSGRSHFAPLTGAWPAPTSLIDSLGTASAYWKNAARQSDGRYLDLSASQETTPSEQPRRTFSLADSPAPDRGPSAQAITRLLRIHWAQRELAKLESAFAPSSAAIIAHCKKQHLVSDFTSLIVLERFSDYVRYQIPPPEPDLLARYRRALADAPKGNLADLITGIWKNRKLWHQTFYPWQEQVIIPAARRLLVWQNALEQSFHPSEINPQVLAQIKQVVDELRRLVKVHHKGPFRTDAHYREWLEELENTQDKIAGIAKIKAGLVTPDQQIHVAINGLIKQPGKLKLAQKTTLLEAVAEAGGIAMLGARSRIALYRGGVKTTYNTRSKHYQDIPLQAGDLIVIQEDLYDPAAEHDPFSGARPARSASHYRDAPAVIEETRGFTLEGNLPPFGPSPQAPEAASGVAFPSAPASADPTNETLETIIREIKAQPDSAALIYQKHRGQEQHSDHFYLSLGDFLLSKNEPALAQRILSNLIASPEAQPGKYRKWAYLCAKHALWNEADQILNAIARHFPDEAALALDRAWICTQRGEAEAAKSQLQRALRSAKKTDPQSWVIPELASVQLQRLNQKEHLTCDLRIVMMSASGAPLNLKVSEPFGTHSWPRRHSSISMIGARSFQHSGICEYLIRHAAPGEYALQLKNTEPQIIRLQIYRDWGKASERLESDKIIILPKSEKRREVATYQFSLE